MEADLLQIMLLQKLSEVSGDEVGIVELAEWERKAKESRRPAEKERYAPPERESVRDQLRWLQTEGRQNKTKHRSHDRER